MKPPVLDQLNLVAADMPATLAFYRQLGLDIPDDAGATSGGHHVEVEMPGGIHLDFDSQPLARTYNAGWRPPQEGGSRQFVGFSVATREDVDRLFDSLTQAGHPGLQPPHDAFWGARYAIVEDPDGRAVGLMSPLDPGRRFAPPEFV